MAIRARFRGKTLFATDSPQIHGDQCTIRRRRDRFGHVVLGRYDYAVRCRGKCPNTSNNRNRSIPSVKLYLIYLRLIARNARRRRSRVTLFVRVTSTRPRRIRVIFEIGDGIY